jgi:TolB protein
VTSGPAIDARPAWSPDGKTLAFVRDDTRETSIVLLDLATGSERVVFGEAGLDLDPAFSADGRWLYLSSALAGDLDLWRVSLATGNKSRLTSTPGLELQPIPLPDGERVVFVAKRGPLNEIRVRTLASGEETVLHAGAILSMLRIALAPDGRTVAYTWPASDVQGWELRLLAIDGPVPSVGLSLGPGQPLTPAWHPDGRAVYLAEADAEERMGLFRVPSAGGRAEAVAVRAWDWRASRGRVRLTTRIAGREGTAPARVAVADTNGHPLVPATGQPRFDGQTGKVFFYSGGTVELEVPVGDIVVEAVRGLTTPVERHLLTVRPDQVVEVDLTLTDLWDASGKGWLSGEHHFHLNYGGPYRLGRGGLPVVSPARAGIDRRKHKEELYKMGRRPPATTNSPGIAYPSGPR